MYNQKNYFFYYIAIFTKKIKSEISEKKAQDFEKQELNKHKQKVKQEKCKRTGRTQKSVIKKYKERNI